MQEDYVGLVLKTITVGESDRLVTILTNKNGIIRAFVKRAKSIKNSNSASTQTFCYSKFSIYMGKSRNSINNSTPIKTFFNLNKDLEKLTVAQYFCELAITLVQDENNSEEFLRLILNAFHLLANTDKDIYLIKAVVELKALCISGYMPDLIGCKKCYKYECSYMYFIPREGVIYCPDCKANTYSIKLDLSTLTAMRYIIYSDFNKIFSFTLPKSKLKLLSDTTQAYIYEMTSKDFKTLEFLENLKKYNRW